MFNAEFELTNRCNTRCLHCPHEMMSRPSGRLDWNTYEIVTQKIRNHVKGERFSLSFSGMGEPMLHPDIYRFIKHVSADAITSFATNGIALNERNIGGLIEAGLDQLYFSFNADEPELFARMMGGLSFERVLANLRKTISSAEGTRLKVWANVSVTKANRDHLTAITELLKDEGITGLCYSMGHTRGGTLRDPAVFDTPPIPNDVTHCDVLSNTLFIDWRGRAFICDHDVHGEHTLGDIVAEPLETVLERRQQLIENGVNYRVCGECNDVLKMGVNFLPDGYSGTLRDWVYDVYRSEDRLPLSSESPQFRWLYSLYAKENRTDRMVQRLIDRSQTMLDRIGQLDDEATGLRRDLAFERAEAGMLRARAGLLTAKLLASSLELQNLEAGSFWRMTSILRLFWQWVENRLLGRGFVFQLVPSQDLEMRGGEYDWHATSNDPGFELYSENGRFPSGWVVVRTSSKRRSGGGSVKLYYGDGEGYGHDSFFSFTPSLKGTILQLVRLPGGITRMRWDPMEKAGDLTQAAIVMSQVGLLERCWLRLARVASTMRQPDAVTRAEAGLTWRRLISDPQGAYEAASALRHCAIVPPDGGGDVRQMSVSEA